VNGREGMERLAREGGKLNPRGPKCIETTWSPWKKNASLPHFGIAQNKKWRYLLLAQSGEGQFGRERLEREFIVFTGGNASRPDQAYRTF